MGGSLYARTRIPTLYSLNYVLRCLQRKYASLLKGRTIMVELYTHLIIRWRYAVVLVTVALVMLAGYGGQKLGFSNDYRMFFGPDNPQLLAFEKMQNTFNKNDNILFVITPKDGKVFTTETLTAVKDITEEAWQIPFSTRVDSITNHQHTTAEEDDLVVDDLVPDPSILTSEDLYRIQSIAINEPMLVRRLISPDSKYTGINITVQLPGEKLDEVPTAVAYARGMKAKYMEKYPGLEIRLVGLTMMNNAFPEASQDDAQNLYPLALVFIIITLLLMLKGLSGYCDNIPDDYFLNHYCHGTGRLAWYPAVSTRDECAYHGHDHGNSRCSSPAGYDET